MDTWGIRSVSLYCGFVLIRRLRSPAKQSATTYGVGRLVPSCSSTDPSLQEGAILVLLKRYVTELGNSADTDKVVTSMSMEKKHLIFDM